MNKIFIHLPNTVVVGRPASTVPTYPPVVSVHVKVLADILSSLKCINNIWSSTLVPEGTANVTFPVIAGKPPVVLSMSVVSILGVIVVLQKEQLFSQSLYL